MKNCLQGGKQMATVLRKQTSRPSDDRIRRLLKKKEKKKENKKALKDAYER